MVLESRKTVTLILLLTNHTTFTYSILRYGIPRQYFCSKYTWCKENMSAVAPEITLTEITKRNNSNQSGQVLCKWEVSNFLKRSSELLSVNCRGSRQNVFWEKSVLKISQTSQGKNWLGVSFFDKVVGSACNFIWKETPPPVKFVKLWRTSKNGAFHIYNSVLKFFPLPSKYFLVQSYRTNFPKISGCWVIIYTSA